MLEVGGRSFLIRWIRVGWRGVCRRLGCSGFGGSRSGSGYRELSVPQKASVCDFLCQNFLHKVWFTHIDSKIQQIERARIRLVHHSNLKLARRDHRHQEIRQMKHPRPKDLFRRIKCPHFQWPLGPFPPPLVDQGEQRQCSQRYLYEQGEWSKEFTLPIVAIWILVWRRSPMVGQHV